MKALSTSVLFVSMLNKSFALWRNKKKVPPSTEWPIQESMRMKIQLDDMTVGASKAPLTPEKGMIGLAMEG